VTESVFILFQSFLELLEARDPFVIVATGVFGLVIGSFLTVVVVRLPIMFYRAAPDGWTKPPKEIDLAASRESVTLIAPRSRCVHCRHQLRWYENIPVVSYVFLRAKCAACGKAISPLYPIVELLGCIAAIFGVVWFGGEARLFGALVLSFALLAIAFVDVRHFIIPDDIVLPIMWLGLLCNAFEMFVPLKDALFGAVAGYGTLWSIYWLHRIVTGKEGMGYGDFKLSAMIGAWLGVGLVPVFLVLAFAGGAIFGTSLVIAGRARIASAIPFGPWLAVAGWVCLYWGNEFIQAYWDLALFW
jgi:leader peptidase (prepilin peptidase)/N-methyltransferase